MNTTIRHLADAVAHELNASDLSPAFTAVRRRMAVFAPEELGALTVSVIPIGKRTAKADRTHRWHDFQVDIAVQQRIAGETDAEPLDQLVEDIDETLFQRSSLQILAGPRWFASELITPNDPGFLDELNLFTAVLRVTYRVGR